MFRGYARKPFPFSRFQLTLDRSTSPMARTMTGAEIVLKALADQGVEHIHAQAGGWPHLVQLVAETAVDMVNNSSAKALDGPLLEKVLEKSIERGENVFRLLLQTESTLSGEWDYLCGFRQRDTQAPPTDPATHSSLRRRLLVVEENGQWRLRVPLMLRWLRQHA